MSAPSQKRKGPLSLGEIVGRVIEPVTARRGFAKADLIAVWPEIAGPMHASCTAPEKIVWPRHAPADDPPAGTLIIRADGPRAIFVQHELPQIVERVNASSDTAPCRRPASCRGRSALAPAPRPTALRRGRRPPNRLRDCRRRDDDLRAALTARSRRVHECRD
jgi:hypothetical protein